MGLAQILKGFNGEAEPRLTSGGEAAPYRPKDFLCKAVAPGNSQYRPR